MSDRRDSVNYTHLHVETIPMPGGQPGRQAACAIRPLRGFRGRQGGKLRAGVERHPNRLEEPGPSAGDGAMGERDSDVEGAGEGNVHRENPGCFGETGQAPAHLVQAW